MFKVYTPISKAHLLIWFLLLCILLSVLGQTSAQGYDGLLYSERCVRYLEDHPDIEPSTVDDLIAPDGQMRLDIVFVIDTTGSMEDDIDAVKEKVLDIIDMVAESGAHWRIGVVTYRDFPEDPGEASDYLYRLELDFADDDEIVEIETVINNITVASGGDTAESLYSALWFAMDMNWNSRTKKAIIFMSDAPPHNPELDAAPEFELENPLTEDNVVNKACELDPVNFYPILIGDDSEAKEAYQRLADDSAGTLYTAETVDETVPAILKAIDTIAVIRPDYGFVIGNYIANRGGRHAFCVFQEISFRQRYVCRMFSDAIEESGGNAEPLQVYDGVDYSVFYALLMANPDTDAIFVADAQLVSVMVEGLTSIGFSPGDIVLGTFDALPQLKEAVCEGYITFWYNTIDHVIVEGTKGAGC